MTNVRNDLGILSERMGGLAALGRSATLAFTVPTVAMGSFFASAAVDFNAGMRNVNSVMRLTEESFQALSEEVLTFSTNTRSTATEVAEGLNMIAQAGIVDVPSAMALTKEAVRAAEAGLADMSDTTRFLTSVFLSYQVPLEDVGRLTDGLTQMVQLGVGTMGEFANTIGLVVPAAASLNIETEELFGSLAFLTQRGLSASRAATSLNQALTSLTKPTEAMQGAMAQLGVRGVEELLTKFGGLNGAIQALLGTTDGTAEAMRKLFSNERGARAIDLLGANFDQTNEFMKEFIGTMDGVTDRARDEQMKSYAAQFDMLKSAVEGASIAIGQQILPIILPLAQGFTKLLSAVTEINPAVIQLGVVFIGIAALLPPILWLFASMVSPIGLLIGGLLALGKAGVDFITDIRAVGDVLREVLGTLLGTQLLVEVTSLWDDLVGILFPTEEEPVVADFITPIEGNFSDFVTVAAGDTLWSIFREGGYADSFSWEEFKALVGLENPNVLTIGQIIEVPGNLGSQLMAEVGRAFTGGEFRQHRLELPDGTFRAIPAIDFSEAMPTPTLADTLLARLGEAFQLVADRLAPYIEPVFTAVKTWADEKIGEGLSLIAGWFTPSGGAEGKTPIYTAVSKLLDGDITGAINDIIPGKGTELAKALGDIDIGTALPKITEGLTTLLTNVGDWLISDGIPTMSRTVGHFAGRLSVLIGQAIGSAFGATDSVGAGIGETVTTPLLEGIREGVEAQNGGPLTNVADLILSNLGAALIVAVGAWTIAPAFATGLMSAIGRGFVGLVFPSLASLTVIGAITKGISAVLGGGLVFVGLAWKIFTAIGLGLKAAALLIGTSLGATAPWAVAAASAISTAIGFAMAAAPVIIGLLTIAGIVKIAVDSGVVAALSDAFKTVFDLALGSGATDTVRRGFEDAVYGAAAGVAEAAGNDDAANLLRGYMSATKNEMFQVLDEELGTFTINPEFLIQNPTFHLELTRGSNIGGAAQAAGVQDQLGDMTDYDWSKFIMPDLTPVAIQIPVAPDFTMEGEKTPAEAVTEALMGSGGGAGGGGSDKPIEVPITPVVSSETGETLAATIIDTVAISNAASAAAASGMSSFEAALTEAVANGQTDPTLIIDSFITPLETKWIEVFGEEGSLRLALQGWYEDFTTKMIDASNKMMDLGNAGKTEGARLAENFTPVINMLNDALSKLVINLNNTANGITNVAQSAQNNAGTLGLRPQDFGVDGAGANGGRFFRGQDILVGERGPEVITMGANGTVIPNSLLGLGGGQQGASSTVNHVNLTINAQDVDNLLYKLRKRGIHLEGRYA